MKASLNEMIKAAEDIVYGEAPFTVYAGPHAFLVRSMELSEDQSVLVCEAYDDKAVIIIDASTVIAIREFTQIL